MLHVKLDLSTIDYAEITGIGVYIKNLANQLLKQNQLKLTGVYKASRFRKTHFMQAHIPNISLEPYLPLKQTTWLKKCDVFHGPDFTIPALKKVKKVVTVHDMIVFQDNIVTSEFAAWGKARFDKMVYQGQPDHIITVSEFAKEEFLKHYPMFEGRVTSIYHGVDHLNTDDKGAIYDFPYFLSVGSLEKRKNVWQLVEAFEQIHQKYPDFRLVIVGGKGGNHDFANRLIEYMKRSPASSHILYLGFVDDLTLASLYKHAFSFVFPSAYEGFGIPILEAMQKRCPVITSNLGATLEVSGDAALHVVPHEPASIAEAMTRLIDDESLRQALIKQGQARYDSFTWERCATQTASVYQQVANT